MSTCNQDFCGDSDTVALVLALEGVPCATIVPLLLGQLPGDVLDQCFEETPDLVDAVGSRLTRLSVLGDPSLGFDLDGDSIPDNALGNLLEQISSLLADSDPNAAVNLLLESGELGLALNWTGLEGQQQLDEVIDGSPLDGYRLGGIGPEGSYVVSNDSLVNGSPRYSMASVQVFDRAAQASGGTLPIYLGFGAGIVFPATLFSAQVRALLEPTPIGIRVFEGQLGGVVPLDDVMAGLNSFLRSERCSCLGLDEDLIQIGAGGYVCQEPPNTSSSCRGEAELCSVIASACTLAIPIITGQADQTLSNGLPALSVFIEFEAEGARLRLP